MRIVWKQFAGVAYSVAVRLMKELLLFLLTVDVIDTFNIFSSLFILVYE